MTTLGNYVYFLQEKYDAFFIFKEFKAMVEKKNGYKLKILRSDRGREYISNIFKNYYSEEGIHQ